MKGMIYIRPRRKKEEKARRSSAQIRVGKREKRERVIHARRGGIREMGMNGG